MPPFIRKRRGWFSCSEIQHLPRKDRKRLTAAALRRTAPPYLIFVTAFVLWIFLVASLQAVEYWRNRLDYSSPNINRDYAVYVLLQTLTDLAIALFGALFVFGFPLSFIRYQRLYRRHLRELMLAEGLRPCFCFDCGYYTEGFGGDECPNCGAALVAPKRD